MGRGGGSSYPGFEKLWKDELAHQLCNAHVLPGHAWAWCGAALVPRVGAEKWGLASQQCLGLALWSRLGSSSPQGPVGWSIGRCVPGLCALRGRDPDFDLAV